MRRLSWNLNFWLKRLDFNRLAPPSGKCKLKSEITRRSSLLAGFFIARVARVELAQIGVEGFIEDRVNEAHLKFLWHPRRPRSSSFMTAKCSAS